MITTTLMGKSPFIKAIIAGVLSGIVFYGMLVPQAINADLTNSSSALKPYTIMKNGHLTVCKLDKSSYEIVKTVKMVITAYSSTPDQTDDTPFITASGKQVKDGIIANNMLQFGTKVRIPKLYGNKVFVVEDRMHSRKGKYHADIWMDEGRDAKNFGAKITDIEIVES